jgi:hypothetical protein
MPATDPQEEQQRLAKTYAELTDEELHKIADDAVSLTDLAQACLREEIKRRGVAVEVRGTPEDEDRVEQRTLVMLRRFRDLPEALLAKGGLESAGIGCFLADDNMVRMDWFISNLLGGIKLMVGPQDVAEATAVLDQAMPESFAVEGVGDYQQPRCPKCGSLDVSFEELNKKLAYTSAWAGLPIPMHRQAWKCHACSAEWQDSDMVPYDSERDSS